MDDFIRYKVRNLDEKLKTKLMKGNRAVAARCAGQLNDEEIYTMEYANYLWQNKYNEMHFKNYRVDEEEMQRLYRYAYKDEPVVPYEKFRKYMTGLMEEENKKNGFLTVEEYAVFRVPCCEMEYYREFPKGNPHTYQVYLQAMKNIDSKYSGNEQIAYIAGRTGYAESSIRKYFE